MIFTLHYDRMHRKLMISLWTQQELASSNVETPRVVEANSHGCRWDHTDSVCWCHWQKGRSWMEWWQHMFVCYFTSTSRLWQVDHDKNTFQNGAWEWRYTIGTQFLTSISLSGYVTSPSLMGKPTINHPFSIAILVYQSLDSLFLDWLKHVETSRWIPPLWADRIPPLWRCAYDGHQTSSSIDQVVIHTHYR